MKPDNRFLTQPGYFWAYVRTISENVGYTVRKKGLIKVPTLSEITAALNKLGLSTDRVASDDHQLTELGQTLSDYFVYRADLLNHYVEPRLMNVERAESEFRDLFAQMKAPLRIPMNKQKGAKKAPAYFTGIINMLIHTYADGVPVDFNPRRLTTVTRDGVPVRTLARQVDGAFPSLVNPIAVWEIKEYYYTTTFGSRVADAVYESLLDGMEIKELSEHESISIRHYLMVDSHYTWWECGRSYLCRIIDMLHMGYLDEALFGYEVVERLPLLVSEWVEATRLHRSSTP